MPIPSLRSRRRDDGDTTEQAFVYLVGSGMDVSASMLEAPWRGVGWRLSPRPPRSGLTVGLELRPQH